MISPYKLIRPVLMRMDEESSHRLAIRLLGKISDSSRLTVLEELLVGDRVPTLPVKALGIQFQNPVGLAAGFDKDGLAFPALAGMGFGFIELGTVTPSPQLGNPGKRIFRIIDDQAIINRLGFNSCGLDAFVLNLEKIKLSPRATVLGVNIGKNTNTPNERATMDYVRCFKGVYRYADYIAVNVSSPNSPGLRDLQNVARLDELLEAITQERVNLAPAHAGKTVPIAVKISPELDAKDIEAIVEIAANRKVDAIIATNSTVTRPTYGTHKNYKENGGLSGKPLREMSTQVIRTASEVAGNSMMIIGTGGISSAEDAWDKMLAGADLLQLYTSFVYQGTSVVKDIAVGLADLARQYDSENFQSAIQQARQKQSRSRT